MYNVYVILSISRSLGQPRLRIKIKFSCEFEFETSLYNTYDIKDLKNPRHKSFGWIERILADLVIRHSNDVKIDLPLDLDFKALVNIIYFSRAH